MQKEVCLPQYRTTLLQTWTGIHLRQYSPCPRKVSRVLHIVSFFLNTHVFQALRLKVLFLQDVNTIHVFPKMVLSLLFNMFFRTLYLGTLVGRDS